MSILKVNNLCYKNLFNNLNFSVDNNGFLSISGANNCGKTTLIRILSKQINNNFDIEVFDKNIMDYKIEEFSRAVQVVIPEEIRFYEKTLYEELSYYINNNSRLLDNIIKGLRLKKIIDKDQHTYTSNEIVLAQLAIALANQPKLLLIDSISLYFNNKELEYILSFLKECVEENNMTVIYTTINLEETIISDRLYIINEGKFELEGKPIDILQKDNIINKIGLNIPFMIDLSVKLRDYDLLDEIILDKDRMVDKLWN